MQRYAASCRTTARVAADSTGKASCAELPESTMLTATCVWLERRDSRSASPALGDRRWNRAEVE
jgi:hypothetical protein